MFKLLLVERKCYAFSTVKTVDGAQVSDVTIKGHAQCERGRTCSCCCTWSMYWLRVRKPCAVCARLTTHVAYVVRTYRGQSWSRIRNRD
jgi:hypothetical protein